MAPLILASQSASRRVMLDAAGIEYDAMPAHIDEAAITAQMTANGDKPREITRALATNKAVAISILNPGRWVIGSDSMVSVNATLYDKPRSRSEAATHLRQFSEQVIRLDSAVSLVRDGHVVDGASDDAQLTVRRLSDAFIASYLDAEWPAIAACVGCFRIEGRGIQLFESITGSHFTILGMPMLPLLDRLRAHGVIAS